ncbi:MAG TPA: tyrosine-protein phosphatase [Acidimicrobiia bacterium]|nr:tyrosine-protein phosphatase [Acidimicrobiia bacterium]
MQAAPKEFERQLRFDGCFNFRDVGGYATPEGRQVRTRRLFRADGPHAFTPRDIAQLQGLELVTVIDLRTRDEARERGRYSATLTDAVEHHLPMVDVLPDPDELPGWIDPLVVAAHYRDMLDRGSQSVAGALAILSDPAGYPAVFHCSAGKDRTGILAAVVLGLLGVPDASIVADYSLSGASMQRLVDYYTETYPEAGERLARIAPAMVAADPLAMASFLEGVRGDYGDFEGYAESIAAGDAVRGLREALLR